MNCRYCDSVMRQVGMQKGLHITRCPTCGAECSDDGLNYLWAHGDGPPPELLGMTIEVNGEWIADAVNWRRKR